MENPVDEISGVIHSLTQDPTPQQMGTIENYFTPNATFTHPFCRTLTSNSKTQIIYIYRWYKIMSPNIDITIKSVAFDKQNLTLYVSISQVFKLFIIPFYKAPVSLVTLLQLERRDKKYYIANQNDLYQTDEFVKFVAPWGGALLVQLWQLMATLFCVLGVWLLWPLGVLFDLVVRPEGTQKVVGGRGKAKELEQEIRES
ncbi:uncharacterized protein BDZ99DRAFT_68391 [Mytilinidion resinicola]|uniref:SigF-like NTF2-like domain-containing protein n=1 Tax=Mytilinidion resinicola TaxID=574789 RepID=A0A6A6YGF6_9PEZI|nr:uncharacterized protein BDZ99DRAFT_68391 [Mytilinidion resinicola]KAF2807896.1 hypothetical protein BDZ99DRAFT_68391 [Mytilinidion resinicola]